MSSVTTTLNNRYMFSIDDRNTFVGQGGMGSVFRGVDSTTQQPVAVKVLKPELVNRDPDILQRFRLEGEALRKLNHPNIVKMFDAAEANGNYYLVMEYVAGGSLRDVLDETPKLTVQRTLYTALDVADALTRAHRLRILHRDIKPDNVLIADDGTPRLTDFGMARMGDEPHITQDGAIVGTMAYLAPEAFQDKEPDERTDIWSFGIMLYEMLAGQRPFPHKQPAALINAIMAQQIPDLEVLRPDAPPALIDLIYRMLVKDRQGRISSVRLIGAELEALLRRDADAPSQPSINVQDSTGRFVLDTDEMPGVNTSSTKIPNNLTTQPTRFVGRERELEALQTLINDGAKLVTLLGVGGIGKTRIALDFAEKNMAQFTDGVYFVAMAGVEDPEHIIPTIGEQIDFTFGSDPKNDLINHLSEKRLLLIIDNFEHLLDGANIVADIVAGAPNVVVMMTSRERLRLRGEQIYEVDGMMLPNDVQPYADVITDYPAVQLFLQSAHRVLPDFEITDNETASCVVQILNLVGGLPLGIELAAAWLEMLPINEIVTEIESSLDFLETDLRDVPERHRSIRAVFEHSWQMMSEDEQTVFMKLAIFRGGFEREAAQKIAGATLRNLTSLVNKSLLTREPNGRYYIQKLLRQYTEERFKKESLDDKMAAYKAHAHYYAAYIGKLSKAFNTSKENAAVDAMDHELENIRMMWHKVVTHGHYDMLADGLDAMHYYYTAHSMFHEGYKTFDELANKLQAEGREDTLYWRTRVRQAWIASRTGRYDNALTYAKGAYDYFKACDNCIEVAHALNQMSYVQMMRGEYEASKASAREALDGIQPREELTAWFMGMGNLGYAHYLAGELREARAIYEKLETTVMDYDYSPSGRAYGLNNLGEILRDMGEINRALELFEEAYAVFGKTKQLRGMAFTANNIGGILYMQSKYDEAVAYYEESYRLNCDIGDLVGKGHSLSALGNVADARGNLDLAEKKYQASLDIRRQLGDKSGIADSLSDLARNALNRGKLEVAEQHIAESINLYREIGDKRGEGGAIAGRGMALVMSGQFVAAAADVEEAIRIGEAIGYPLIALQGYVSYGEIMLHEERFDEAMRYYKKALATISGKDVPVMVILFALMGIARVRMAQGDYQGALELVLLIQRYPPQFLTMVEKKAKHLMDVLSERVDKVTLETATVKTQSLDINKVVADLLKE